MAEFANPFVTPYLCERCKDFRVLAEHASMRTAVPCPNCGTMTTEEYEKWSQKRWGELQKVPEICELDLTDEELKVFKQWRLEHPGASKMTILSWMEGRRYDPSKDPEFLKEAREAFKAWRNR